MEKNTNAIDKIIAELSMISYNSAVKKLTESQKRKIREGKTQFSYTLSADALDAIQIKRDYISGKITESEYKRYCIEYNLRTR